MNPNDDAILHMIFNPGTPYINHETISDHNADEKEDDDDEIGNDAAFPMLYFFISSFISSYCGSLL